MMKPKRMPPPSPARRRRAPRGSVLILVVSLLVLIALIGTAWLSTTRVDRANTFQNTHNNQIDLLADGVARMAEAKLIADLFDGPNLRRAGGQYSHTDSNLADDYLASRVPVLREEVALE
jgi:hypothetical protein